MSKKAVCCTVLWLANTLLLLHAAVPHHHHGDTVICFLNSHCKESHEVHNHEQHAPYNDEHSETPCSAKCCSIDNIYMSEGNSTKNVCRSHINCDCGQVIYALIPCILNTSVFSDDIVSHSQQKPDIPLFYTDFVSQSVGLRAPPVC